MNKKNRLARVKYNRKYRNKYPQKNKIWMERSVSKRFASHEIKSKDIPTIKKLLKKRASKLNQK